MVQLAVNASVRLVLRYRAVGLLTSAAITIEVLAGINAVVHGRDIQAR